MADRAPALDAVLVTCARPGQLLDSLTRIDGSTLRPRRVVVVDNHGSPGLDTVIHAQELSLEIELLTPGTNLGPAGGRALGFNALTATGDAHPDDWVAFVDDDEPLPSADALHRLFEAAVAWHRTDPAAAAMGLAGAKFDPNRAINRRVTEPEGAIDNLHGWGFPLYRVGPLEEIGGFDPAFFFGYEELDLGLRLTQVGYRLRVHFDLADELRAIWGRPATVSPSAGLEQASWKRYYSLRNLLTLTRRHGRATTIANVAIVRGLAKPIVHLVTDPALATSHLRLNTRAIADGLRGRTGRSVEPDLHHREWDTLGVSATFQPQSTSGPPSSTPQARGRIVELYLASRLDHRTAERLLVRAGADRTEAPLLLTALDDARESPVIRWGPGAPINATNFYDDGDDRAEASVKI